MNQQQYTAALQAIENKEYTYAYHLLASCLLGVDIDDMTLDDVSNVANALAEVVGYLRDKPEHVEVSRVSEYFDYVLCPMVAEREVSS